ncbi:hypothetical protein SISNIDRAFT_482545 [Sistotremastrum niveocremeum HHB9708]|uniref:Glycosyltransferase family 69 protein n=2 Tax=Sistotremastraceae TaxID=3402574 RepID=A0A164YB77_9AGAM|nr:hypothetical protein SISNIDRAFT_482545 [Sistotremastrum niveocremeum HHB9708]KZT40172.1 hypothetical protein SISSUDRAFT_1032134 [Sistotremastrum suecicum HHB10207 ss-3]
MPTIVERLIAIPTALKLLFALALGLSIGHLSRNSGGTTSEPWIGSGSVKSFRPQRVSSSYQMPLPTIDQRKRILDILSSLTAHHTRECTRYSQEAYVNQATERYAPLIGHKAPSTHSAFFNVFGGTEDEHALHRSSELSGDQHKYFFAINLYNSFDVIPDLFATLFRVGSVLGYHNVFVSIYENGSKDQTKALLRIFDALTRSVGMRITIRTSARTRGSFTHRIEYLAEVRNSAMVPLHERRDEGEFFDTVIFMNDVLPCVDDLLELIYQSRLQNAGITCAADYMYHDDIGAPVFYDNWVARDLNGTALENAPFENIFHHEESSSRFQRHLPVQVQSCWNGIAILDPAPIYQPPRIKFRMADIASGECSASECSLIGNDYWAAGFGRIVMVPRVKLAYDKRVYDIIHPPRRNLTAIRGYVKLGGLEDDPRSDPQDRSWYGPHDRLFVEEESQPLDFQPGPEHVWCWGWDGAGEIDGPDVDPIWEKMPDRSTTPESVSIKHDRSMAL